MLRLFKGQPSVVHVRVKRHLMKDLPETDEAVAQWCNDLFVAKDDILDKHKAEDTFPDAELHYIGRPLKSLVVVTSWACLLVFGTMKFFQWSNLFLFMERFNNYSNLPDSRYTSNANFDTILPIGTFNPGKGGAFKVHHWRRIVY